MSEPPGPGVVDRAVEALRAGRLVIIPTDTVYGIAADARNAAAVRAIYAAKQRDPSVPLQLLFGRDSALVDRYAVLTDGARRLMDSIGPGPWTVIVPVREGWDSPALAGGRTVGVRIVPVDLVLDLVDRLGAPLAASSANTSDGPSPVTCAEADRQVGDHCALAIDTGPTAEGMDSTVIDLSGPAPRILREGAIDRQIIARILGVPQIPVLRSVRP